jgi:hypothetical protein
MNRSGIAFIKRYAAVIEGLSSNGHFIMITATKPFLFLLITHHREPADNPTFTLQRSTTLLLLVLSQIKIFMRFCPPSTPPCLTHLREWTSNWVFYLISILLWWLFEAPTQSFVTIEGAYHRSKCITNNTSLLPIMFRGGNVTMSTNKVIKGGKYSWFNVVQYDVGESDEEVGETGMCNWRR